MMALQLFDHAPQLLATVVVLFTVSCLVVGARCYVRLRFTRFGLDDGLMVGGFVCYPSAQRIHRKLSSPILVWIGYQHSLRDSRLLSWLWSS